MQQPRTLDKIKNPTRLRHRATQRLLHSNADEPGTTLTDLADDGLHNLNTREVRGQHPHRIHTRITHQGHNIIMNRDTRTNTEILHLTRQHLRRRPRPRRHSHHIRIPHPLPRPNMKTTNETRADNTDAQPLSSMHDDVLLKDGERE